MIRPMGLDLFVNVEPSCLLDVLIVIRVAMALDELGRADLLYLLLIIDVSL